MARITPSVVVGIIERSFPWAKNIADGNGSSMDPSLAADQAPAVGMVVALVRDLPEELLPPTTEGRTRLIAGLGAMEAVLRVWASGSHPGYQPFLRSMSGLGGDHPIVAVLKALRASPDEAPIESTPGLRFISDEKARTSLRIDIATAHRAAGNGEYKAATVLAGSVIEALLLWCLKGLDASNLALAIESVNSVRKGTNGRQLTSGSIDAWHLSDYLDVASAAGVLDASTVSAVKLSNEFRNLIHPGRVLRSGMDASQATALSALGAMERVLEILSGR